MAAVPKVAIVADWLTNMGGAERTVLAMHHAFPDAPIFTSVFEADRMPLFKTADIRTTYLQKLPAKLRSRHQLFPVFRAHAFRHIDLSEYDIVISSASAEAKAIRVKPGTTHICYCHTPIRYYWSHYEEYKKDPGFGILDPIIKLIIPPFVWWMRKADLKTIKGVDYFLANSKEVQARIKKYYHREADVLHPPVDVERFRPRKPVTKEDYYVMAGRQIPYKRMDLAIQACNKLGKRLIVIGQGSEHEKLVALGGPTVEFKTGINDQQIVEYFQKARGFIWPQVEDFGITAVEAMAAGTPVIAYGAGGAFDYMIEGITGVFFAKQTVSSLIDGITRFEQQSFESKKLITHAAQFSEKNFIKNIQDYVLAHHKS